MFLVLLVELITGSGFCDVEEEVVEFRKERTLQGLPEKSPRRLSLHKRRYQIYGKLALLTSTNKDNGLFREGTLDRKELLITDFKNVESLLWRVIKQTPPLPHALEVICSRLLLMCKHCYH
jgi:hypothetical protein